MLPGIGYTDANQSHFTSRHYWEVGATSERLRTGWLGRYLDRVGSPDNPLQGISLDYRLQPALATGRMPVASIDAPDSYDFWARGVWGEVEERMLATIGTLGAIPHGGDPGLAQATNAARQSAQLRRSLAPFRSRDGEKNPYGSQVPYPEGDDEFPRRLAGLAAMLARGLPIRCAALSAPGVYDTHDDQPTELAEGLKLTADSLLAFQRDLEVRGIADRVLVHVWSEFGRRAKENGSNGTDHGAAGAGFLLGSQASGRMVGEFPGLAKLDADGNLRATSDFRGLYASLLEDWLGGDAEAIFLGARSRGRRSCGDRVSRCSLGAALLPAPRRAVPGTGAGVGRRVLPRAVADSGPRRAGDRRARELRRGRARPGAAPHRPKGARTFRIADVRPGRLGDLEPRLVPGRYALWCTLADHRARGMRATLVVRAR